jgi:hypothetical protein
MRMKIEDGNEASYQEAWDRLRKLEQLMRRGAWIVMMTALLDALVLIGLEVNDYLLNFVLFFGPLVVATALFQIQVTRWWAFQCPRCGKSFFYTGGWFHLPRPLTACRHCKLPKFSA